jgi:hypothetical protein
MMVITGAACVTASGIKIDQALVVIGLPTDTKPP